MARLTNKQFPVASFDTIFEIERDAAVGYDGFDKVMKEHTKTLDALQKASDKLKVGEIVGFLLSIPWADGYAYYLVTNDEPLTLQPVLVHDAWQVPYYQIRGLRKSDIVNRQKSAKKIGKLFVPRSMIGNRKVIK